MKKQNIKSGNRFVLFVLLSVLYLSCGDLKRVQPIPADKQSFIGYWKSDVGISIEILSKGTANIIRLSGIKGAEKLDINASDPTNFRVYFLNDSTIQLIQPFNIAREYKIDQYPFKENQNLTMKLNGVKLVKELKNKNN